MAENLIFFSVGGDFIWYIPDETVMSVTTLNYPSLQAYY